MIAFAPELPRRRRTRPFRRFVRVLVAASLVLVFAVILTGYLKLGAPSGAGRDSEAARDRQRIETPVYTTRLSNGVEMNFSAEFAIPHEQEPDVVSLRTVEIDGNTADKRPFSARSDHGTLRFDEGLLVLFGNVTGTGPSRERIYGSSVTLDNRAEVVWSVEPVRIVWGSMELEAGDMRIEGEDGRVLAKFSNGVRMVYRVANPVEQAGSE